MKSTLKNMVLVLCGISAIAALLVGLVNDLTMQTIADTEHKNKDIAKLEVLPEFKGEPILEEQVCNIGDFVVAVTKVMTEDAVVGYAVEAPSITKSGYADRIVLMVGFVEGDAGVTISGVKVLSQKETPGLGANMTKEGNSLERSILGGNPAEISFKVKKDDKDGTFDSLTGSTISSRAYANAVETAYAAYLWAKGELPSSSDAMSGATPNSNKEVEVVIETVDVVRGATVTEEPVAQEGESCNE